MIKANIVIDKKIWEKKLKKPEIYFKKKLNKLSKFSSFRNKNVSTDVLSFPLKAKLKNKLYLGDIAISFEIINRRSKSSSFDHELDKMWIHGYLHLLGHDHKKDKDYYLMKRKENLIFKKLNKIN